MERKDDGQSSNNNVLALLKELSEASSDIVWECLEPLSRLPSLHSIVLRNNPLPDSYRKDVVALTLHLLLSACACDSDNCSQREISGRPISLR